MKPTSQVSFFYYVDYKTFSCYLEINYSDDFVLNLARGIPLEFVDDPLLSVICPGSTNSKDNVDMEVRKLVGRGIAS